MPKALLAVMSALALATPVAAQEMKFSGVDRDFVTKAAKDNNYELEAARLALAMSTRAETKSFAEQIITDHTKLAADLKAAVLKADPAFTLPDDVDEKGQANLDALRNAGDRFDAVYRDRMVSGHSEVQKAFDEYAECSDANLGIRAVAREAISTIRRHKDMAKDLPTNQN
jgi:putative membrane protein